MTIIYRIIEDIDLIFFFQFFSDDEFIQFMKALPEVVFISPDDAEEEKSPPPVAPSTFGRFR